ncbi:MAG: hypothetical protein A2231_00410 [Candidatus Firestonebacteria bacterium RIFOXYA2_FULL_40_8]|nr:MAG: hypothetical protein A2231_00410 [Candidatus Firestonebacteria bacterium RIFOXYA2_FULL_40_8]
MIKNDFEKRYSREPLNRKDPDVENAVQAAKDNTRKAALTSAGYKNPEAMAYFYDILTTDKREKELIESKAKVTGTYCYFAPEEIIYAAGAVPVRLCSGIYETITTSEEVLPRDICPLCKSSLGCRILGLNYTGVVQMIVLPASCDAKKKLGEYLSDYLPVVMLNLPNVKDYRVSKEVWLREIKSLKVKLEEFTGKKITKQSLKHWTGVLKSRALLFRDIFEMRKKNPGIISHRDFLAFVQASFYDDIMRWMEHGKILKKELEERIKNYPGFKGERLLLTGAPVIFPNFKILSVIEDLGALVTVDELCSGTQRLWDYSEPDEWTMEGMLEALASRYMLPSTCPCFTTSYDRIDKLLHLAEEFKVDGVVYHDLRLCQLFDMERNLVAKVLADKNIPVITIHTEYSQEDTEQVKTRIEAFLEMIRSNV